MNRLLARLDVLIASSTASSTSDTDLRSLVGRASAAHAGRAAAGPKASMVRSDRIRARIRAAWGRRSLAGPIDAATVNVCARSMQERGWHADQRTIADELATLKAEEQAGTEVQHVRPRCASNLTYRST